MDKRTLFYCSRLLTEGFEEGQNYMNLPDVIAVNILNFEQYPELTNFHNVIHLWDDTFKVKIDPLEIHLLELIKLGDENNVLNIEIPLHQWALYFKQSTTMEMINKLKNMNPAIMKAEMKIQKALSDEATRRAYFLREKARNDYVSAMDNATRKGKQEGKLEGMQQKEREMILDGLRLGIPMETIAQMAKQPLDYVRSVIDKKT
jgi:predicted transposase/invertase (TIGR01784 family)